ncbi:hypothetical protein OXPF_27010 [Oxobacter pfennigii]|uniref:Uncharacterized protein n=2 Tax=Oxobacter pfennigii TaxID=36849 RepID=A0A0P8YVV8_9CLOT|nr:hypothetical protein OXPF_27010 [Oxobacter pfennigii]
MYPYLGSGSYIQCPVFYRQSMSIYSPYFQMRSDQYAGHFFPGINQRIYEPGVTPDIMNEQKLKEIEAETEVLTTLKNLGLSDEEAKLLILRIIEVVNE